MGMQAKYLDDFYVRVSQDETILRYLTYKPTNASDNPLSPTKPNIVGTARHDAILGRNILPIPKNDDIESDSICRICMYMGSSTRTSNPFNYRHRVVIDTFVHNETFENVDGRLGKITDQLDNLLVNKHVTGMGKVENIDSGEIAAPRGYVGYRNVYSFWGTK